ncbi:hypothetical protein [Pseudomonas sichuanensis]|uniref:hypothetical protein n=1 Tax=Pseudomonas sichuanensis TaxID=2213015 RepID=UPI00130095F1|nr:hypothetical protein [Pseudomonas sichuanensis]
MTQLFYRHSKSGEVYCYDCEQHRELFGSDELVLMDANEVRAHLDPPKRAPSRADVERARLVAYADPINGSDRFKIEADAERLSGNDEAAQYAEQKWLRRRAEISAKYPWEESE